MPLLELRNLHATVEGTPVLAGVNLVVNPGEFHLLMGPNGSGKSSLALTVMGHPGYTVTTGEILFEGKSIIRLKPEERAKRGIFLSFQHPAAVPGVSVANLVRTSYKHLAGKASVDVKAFRARMQDVMGTLHMKPDMLDRSVNDGFSGGEKKLTEILQLAMLRPKLILLDEVDSGLDLDALKRMSDILVSLHSPDRAFLLITHNPRVLRSIRPDVVHVFREGRVVQTGAAGLVREVEQNGFERLSA